MMHTFVGGPRFSLRTFPLTTPFAEFLVGMTHLHESFAELDANEFAFTIQPGGGIDIGNERTAARFSFAWRRGFFEGESGWTSVPLRRWRRRPALVQRALCWWRQVKKILGDEQMQATRRPHEER